MSIKFVIHFQDIYHGRIQETADRTIERLFHVGGGFDRGPDISNNEDVQSRNAVR